MADYFTQFSCQLYVGTRANAALALAIYRQFALELDEAEGVGPGFEVDADDKSVLWIHDRGDYGDPEHVIAFVLRCADAFDLKGRWGFVWALSCSKPRLDGFGGGAQVLDLGARASVAWIDAETWLTDQLDDTAPAGAGAAGVQAIVNEDSGPPVATGGATEPAS